MQTYKYPTFCFIHCHSSYIRLLITNILKYSLHNSLLNIPTLNVLRCAAFCRLLNILRNVYFHVLLGVAKTANLCIISHITIIWLIYLVELEFLVRYHEETVLFLVDHRFDSLISLCNIDVLDVLECLWIPHFEDSLCVTWEDETE